MEVNTTAEVIERIHQQVERNEDRTATNLEWLQQAMHPLFFKFNRDEADALSVLVEGINRLERLPYIRLTDRPERFY